MAGGQDCTHSLRPSSWPSFGRMRKCCQFFHRWRTPAQAAHIRLWARCSFAVCDTRQLWQPAEDGPAGCLGKTTAGRPGPGPYRRPPLPVVQQTRSHSCSVLASLETARRSASAADHLDSRRHWAAVRPSALCTSGTSSVSPFTPGLEALALKQWHSSKPSTVPSWQLRLRIRGCPRARQSEPGPRTAKFSAQAEHRPTPRALPKAVGARAWRPPREGLHGVACMRRCERCAGEMASLSSLRTGASTR